MMVAMTITTNLNDFVISFSNFADGIIEHSTVFLERT